ncbi:hypothetical protein SKAU_G00009400 [Synaphobranchus kaupii]|uniref:Kinase suppressor RAS 1 N-terminal helical hairpin domain-containing protein n=1 Tax=Synaphobranchus kaupii TaxID=118154 RepID=A0A9Q1GBJ6_SYNKA|nr:hypothetical protein SKAU_G00009400 [Synaphobranchus kaupii]
MDEENMTKSEEQHLSLQKALQQCELVQNMIDISISSLEGLRTKCATSNDLTQKEIRTLEGKLVKYFSRQLSCKRKVASPERSAELEEFPHLGHWFRIVNMRKEVTEDIGPGQVTLEGLLEMNDEQVCEEVQKFGASAEECARLNAALSCLRSVHQSGSSQAKQDWAIQWPSSGKENAPVCPPEPSQWIRFQLSQSPKVQSKYNQHFCNSPQTLAPSYTHVDRLTVDGGHLGLLPPLDAGHRSLPPSPRQRHFAHTPPRTPLVVNTMTPPGTPPMRRRNKVKAPGTPPALVPQADPPPAWVHRPAPEQVSRVSAGEPGGRATQKLQRLQSKISAVSACIPDQLCVCHGFDPIGPVSRYTEQRAPGPQTQLAGKGIKVIALMPLGALASALPTVSGFK